MLLPYMLKHMMTKSAAEALSIARKFVTGEPYSIVAGQKRGVLSGSNLVGLEYDFSQDDRDFLEPFGINPIVRKRNIGLDICRANGCDAMMTLDCDELYDPKEFKFAKEDFEIGDYDTSFCKMSTYYKEPIYRLYPKEEYYSPLFYKIKKDTEFGYVSSDYPVILDPTRKVKAGYSRIFEREEIEMHHYAYVRNDIASKVINSSSQSDEVSKQKVIFHYNNFKDIRDSALMIGGVAHGLMRVENKFDIQL
mgnify:CR=1 FL=1